MHLMSRDTKQADLGGRARPQRWAWLVGEEGRRWFASGRPRTGRPGRLDARAWGRLERLLAREAVAAGFETERWTLRRIAAVIWREFGVAIKGTTWSGP